MTAYAWRRGYNGNQSLSTDVLEWDEVWNVYGYVEPADGLAMLDLTADRPDLRPGQPHPAVPMVFAETFVPERHGTSEGWACTVRWKSRANEQGVHPLARPAEISVETETVQVPTFKRVNGTPIINTAGGLIYGQTRPINRKIFNFEKNVAVIPDWLLEYSDIAVNSDTVEIDGLTFRPKYLQLQKVRGSKKESEQFQGQTVVYRVLTFSLVYDPRGWDEEIYNRGLFEIDGGKWRRIVDDDKEPVDEPQFLDGSGKRLAMPADPASIITVPGVGVTSLPFNGTLPLT